MITAAEALRNSNEHKEKSITTTLDEIDRLVDQESSIGKRNIFFPMKTMIYAENIVSELKGLGYQTDIPEGNESQGISISW